MERPEGGTQRSPPGEATSHPGPRPALEGTLGGGEILHVWGQKSSCPLATY